MKVSALIAKLLKADPEADVYRCWCVSNESGTSFETGQLVDRLESYPAHRTRGKKKNARVEIW